jgi:hypothetical protein
VSFATIIICVASQQVFIVVVYFIMTQSGNFWIHLHINFDRVEATQNGHNVNNYLSEEANNVMMTLLALKRDVN